MIEKARDYLGLSELEKPTSKGGRLCVYVDDALSPSQDVSGRYAGEISKSIYVRLYILVLVLNSYVYLGIIVDLFADGKVLDQLQQVLYMVMIFGIISHI